MADLRRAGHHRGGGRTRPLNGQHRHLWVDATYHKPRVEGRAISQATVVAVGVTTDSDRQVRGIDVGPSEDRAFWTPAIDQGCERS